MLQLLISELLMYLRDLREQRKRQEREVKRRCDEAEPKSIVVIVKIDNNTK